MILKSYEIQRNPSNLLKYNVFLLYGENSGLKKDIRESIKTVVSQQDANIELLSLYENDIIDNEENFYNSIYSGSLFSNKKIISINNGTDKIIKQVNDDQEFIQKTNHGGEFMEEDDQERVANIGNYKWKLNGKKINFLDEKDVQNLQIPK